MGTLLFTGCSQLTMTRPEPTPAEAESMVPQDIGGEIIAEAVVEPVCWSELHFTGGGMVVGVLVEEGDAVDEGDLLVQLDASDVQLRVQEAEAALALTRAQLAQVRAATVGRRLSRLRPNWRMPRPGWPGPRHSEISSPPER
jgi:multidrug efflux pump subunit AcrA (membrane-fusion protein)